MRWFTISVLIQLFFFSSSLCEVSLEKQDSFLNDFVDYLNSRPDHPHVYDDGLFLKSTQLDPNTYKIDIRVKVFKPQYPSSYYFEKCTATIIDLGENGITIPNNEYQCIEWVGDETTPVAEGATTDAVQVFEEPLVKQPIHLDNEVQPNNAPTSGEQFIAIPRDRSGPCIGCSSHVDPSAAGVGDLAALGARHLDKHEPTVRHTVIAVHDVERQVQVTNGIRYVLTLTVGYNNCTELSTDNCVSDRICKISVISKPWVKLPDGSKYKAILANNCTEQWLFGDDGEPVPETLDENKRTPDNDKVANSGSADEIIKVVHTADIQAQQHTQVPLSNEQIKNIQEQIIPYSEFDESRNPRREIVSTDSILYKEKIENIESVKNPDEDTIQVRKSDKLENTQYITEDKKKAIDDMLNLFNFAEFQPLHEDTIQDLSRGKRSYSSDLKVMSVLEKFQKVKRKLKNAKHIYKLGNLLVDYLNEMDMEVKTRILKDVIFAEEEIEKDQHFFYIRARVIIPCDKVECDSKDTQIKICNGVIDSTDSKSPEVVDTFCYNEEKKSTFGNVKDVPNNDPILLKLTNETIKKIENDMYIRNALRVVKIINANTQKVSGTLTKISMVLEFINCNKTVPFYKRKNCSTVHNLGTKICEAEIHERPWLKEKQITYTCTDRPMDETIEENGYSSRNKDTKDSQVIDIVNEALQFLEVQSNRKNKQKIVEIKKVSTEIVAGQLTNIYFIVGYTKCFINDLDIDVNNCELIEGERLRKCQAQVWERPWLQEGRQLKVVCDDTNKTEMNENETLRKKRQIAGGPIEVDANDPQYMQLAQESLSKYLKDSGDTKQHNLIKVNKVTVQVVAGTLTKIYFDVQSAGEVFSCQSDVWERPWLNSKEITVTCGENQNSRQRRQIPGGDKEVDANDPKYMQLAQESLSKYLKDSGDTKQHSVVKVNKVTVQVVAGTLTKIYFDVQGAGEVFSCQSEVWERPWLNSKEITVTCGKDQNSKKKRQIVGGAKEVDANNPKYLQLAQESLSKYLKDSGDTKPHTVVKVDKVTVQVVAGTLTKIYFKVQSAGEVFSCQSDVWERPWLNSKEITVTCGENQNSRQRRQIPGGDKEVDANDPKYMQLAQESLSKYLKDSGDTKQHSVVKVNKVTVQVVAGTLTKIYFDVQGAGEVFSCQSEVWERPWLNSKEITVTCGKDQNSKKKRQIVGGAQEVDANNPKYLQLAQESLSKYLKDSGDTKPHIVVKMDKVTVQVVAGTLTKIYFKVQSAGEVFSCQSDVWERPWLNSKEITVTCGENQNSRQRRQIPGGDKEVDANDPKYMQLAQESLSKYLKDSGDTKQHSVVKVNKVTVQVVAGTLTKIYFDVQGAGEVFSCQSEVWERPWLNSKEITVTCGKDQNSKQKRLKREIIVGGAVEEDPKNENFIRLAEESLNQYVANVGSTKVHKLIELIRVTKLLESGTLTRLDFVMSPTNCDIYDKSHKVCSALENINIRCHADIWERPWLKGDKKIIDVTCDDLKKINENADNLQGGYASTRVKSHTQSGHKRQYGKKNSRKSGGPVEQDPAKPLYRVLADEALRKYQLRKKSLDHHEITHVNRVFTQVVSGTKYTLEFEVLRISCALNEINKTECDQKNNVTLTCHAVIWSRPWLKSKEVNVDCSSDEDVNEDSEEDSSSEEIKRKTRAIGFGLYENKDPNDKTYINLAKEAVKKYQKNVNADHMFKINKILRVTEQVASGFVTNIDFSISPTICLLSNPSAHVDDCQLQTPQVVLYCSAEINEPSIPRTMKIKIGCKKRNKKKNTEQEEVPLNREKRNIPYDDDYVEEDIKYYYADRAISDFNKRASTNNLYKVVSIHDVHRSVHMDTLMVRLYLEIAMTYCMRYGEEHDLQNCDEIDGMNHKLCLARVYPSPDDELVVQHATMTCDDDKNFETISGISIDEFIRVSIAEIEKSPDIHYKLVPLGEPKVIPSLNYKMAIRMNFVVHHTNCSKEIDLNKTPTKCVINLQRSGRNCHSLIYLMPNSRNIQNVVVKCSIGKLTRAKRSVSLNPKNATSDDLLVQQMVQESIEKLEMASEHKYKQRVLVINGYSSKIVSGRLTTIDFDVGYTTCLKYEWVENATSCEFLEHLPRRHCISHVWERLWVDNGRQIIVNCEDDETPLEAHIEFESAENAMQLANEALKHIEAKYPNPRRQKIVRIFSLEQQAIAGLHYRMKVEVGVTDCMALSINKDDCKLVNDMNSQNKFCRVNVWMRPWTDHPPSFRVTCDYQSGAMDEIYHHVQAERLFYDFLTTYKPDYLNDVTEMKKRFAIFKENVRKIHELNIYERGTARYAVTRFADLSYEEFSLKYLGLKPGLQNHNQVPMRMAEIPDVELPAKYDWRDYGAVTEVKDQGSCGSCWAFSVTGNIEGQWKLQSGKLVSLSEQELVDCDDLDNGCNGGLPDNAYRAIEKLGGLETENDYPYEATDDKCAFNRSLSRVHISGAVNITSNETDMAKWLTRNGPISIGINANAMQFYVGGISHPWKMLCNPNNLDHGVLIVGYGAKDYPLFHKHLPYWIIKNSWGERWGEQGYYRVYRGDGTCGVNQMASSAVI